MSEPPASQSDNVPAADPQRLAELQRCFAEIETQIAQRIVGQKTIIRELMITLLANGHALLVGVPGLAKTLLIRTLAETLAMDFKRIQFTPDLMPADVTGTEIIFENRATGEREFRFVPGPIFAHLVLADEINRTPPKTQAALLEAMQERQVTIGGVRHPLPEPFFVLATQNPLEQEGTYPLPEAQLDRFLFQMRMDYPQHHEELAIALSPTGGGGAVVQAVLDPQRLRDFQALVQRMPIAPVVADYAVRIARGTRPDAPDADPALRQRVRWGAGPRASQHLVLAARAHAALAGEFQVRPEDVQAVALPVLRHRVRLSFAGEAEGIDLETFLTDLIQRTPVEGEPIDREFAELLRSEDAR